MINDYNAYVYWYAKRFYGLIGDSEPGVTNQRDGYPQLRGILMSHYSKYAAAKYRYNADWKDASFSGSPAAPSGISITAYMDDDTITMVMHNSNQLTFQGRWINIRLPEEVQSAFAIETYTEGGAKPGLSSIDPSTRIQVPTPVIIDADNKTAHVFLRQYSFLSVRFYK
jgi:hypothetical protein